PDPYPGGRINLLVLAARNAGDLDAARLVLAEWEKMSPGGVEHLALRAEIEYAAGAYPAALAAARAVLAKQPEDNAMRLTERDCLSKLRRDPALPPDVAPPPRPAVR